MAPACPERDPGYGVGTGCREAGKHAVQRTAVQGQDRPALPGHAQQHGDAAADNGDAGHLRQVFVVEVQDKWLAICAALELPFPCVRRDKAALIQWVQAPPCERSSRKQPEQSWRKRSG